LKVFKEKYMAMIEFEKEASAKKALSWTRPFFKNKDIKVHSDDLKIPPP